MLFVGTSCFNNRSSARCTSGSFLVYHVSMKIVQATLWIYAAALRRSFRCVAHNWVISFAPLVYGLGLSLVGLVVSPLGIVGGLFLGLATQACLSSGLHLLDNMGSIFGSCF
jgi:hypothetical protein